MVRSKNVFFTLEKVLQLAKEAFASIDTAYWTKFIQHVYKVVEYYIHHDTVMCIRRVQNFSAWPGRHLERFNTHAGLAL